MSEPLHESPQPRPVPWNGVDVGLIFLLWISLMFVCGRFAVSQIEPDGARESTTEHPLTQLIERGKERPVVLIVAFLSGVVLAPLAEEFLFRLLLLGWLRKLAGASEIVSILIVSVVFASIHGGQRTEQSVDMLFYGMIGLATANLLTILLGMMFLSRITGADRTDLGVGQGPAPGQIVSDLAAGLWAFLLCGPVIFGLNYWLRLWYPETPTDPIPLFFFSVVLGILYCRTGRLLPCVTLHACLNGFSFVVLALS